MTPRGVARKDLVSWRMLLVSLALSVALGITATQPQYRSFALVAAGLVALLGLFFEAPELALLAFVVLRPIVDAFVYLSLGGFSVGEAWGIGLIAASVVYLLSRRSIRMPTAPVALLVTYVTLTFVRPSLSVALTTGLKLLLWVLLAAVVEQIAMTRKGQELVLTAMCGSAIVLLSVIALVASQGQFGSAYYFSRTAGLDAAPHALTSLAVLTLPFILAQILAGIRPRLSFLLVGLLSLGIVESFVRSGYLALLAVLGGYLFASLRVTSLRAKGGLLVIVGALGFAGYRAQASIVTRLADLPLVGNLVGSGSTTSPGAAGSGRWGLWKELFARGTDTLSHIVVGRGAGASFHLSAQAFGESLGSHNDFLEFFIAGGAILLTAYVSFLAWIAFSVTRLTGDPRQSTVVRSFSILALGSLLGYVFLSLTNGIALAAGGTVMAVFVGLTRGMSTTPGETVLDLPDTVHSSRRSRSLRTQTEP